MIDHDEATGMNFDSLWVMGCTANTLPEQSDPNPFIPIPLQRDYKIPHSGSDWELESAEKKISSLWEFYF